MNRIQSCTFFSNGPICRMSDVFPFCAFTLKSWNVLVTEYFDNVLLLLYKI